MQLACVCGHLSTLLIRSGLHCGRTRPLVLANCHCTPRGRQAASEAGLTASADAGTVKQVYKALAPVLMLPPGDPRDLLLLAEVGLPRAVAYHCATTAAQSARAICSPAPCSVEACCPLQD